MIRFKLSRSHEQIRGVLDGIRILSDSGSVRERLIDYGAWLYSSERSLCSIADDEDVAALLHSPRHRRLIQAATTVGHYQEGEAYTNLMSQQLGLEVEATIRKIQDLRDEVQAAHERWSQAVSIAVLDTSLVMEHQADIGTVDLHSILGADQSGVVGAVIPITVVEELERQKDRGQDGDRRPAREALRLIESWFPDIRLSVAPSVMRHADTKRSV